MNVCNNYDGFVKKCPEVYVSFVTLDTAQTLRMTCIMRKAWVPSYKQLLLISISKQLQLIITMDVGNRRLPICDNGLNNFCLEIIFMQPFYFCPTIFPRSLTLSSGAFDKFWSVLQCSVFAIIAIFMFTISLVSRLLFRGGKGGICWQDNAASHFK